MYFSNIANSELQYFHNIVGADFSMSLTDILDSDLFKVEEIIGDTIYRIYPLFYCKNIISSNSKDIVLDTRCLILEKNDNETYLSFITDDNTDNIILNESILNIKDIGDNLSTDEFNSLVYRLRQKGALTGSLNFENNNAITGVFATYQFNNVDGQLRNDSGIIVNNRVKNNQLTVRLLNPFFLNAQYTLIFTVKSITGANICEENKGEFITKDTFSIDLIEGSDVVVPLNRYTNDDVLDFNVDVNISFNVPEIVNSSFNFDLEIDKSSIFISDDITLTARLSGEDNVAGYTVEFFKDGVLIGSEPTNANGVATLNDTPIDLGSSVYSATVLGLSDEVNLIVYQPNLVLQSNKATAFIPTNFIVTGTLADGNKVFSNKTIKLYDNDILIDTLTTDSQGKCSKTITANTIKSHSIYAIFEDNEFIANSNVLTVTARKLNTNLSINSSNSSYYSQAINITGYLTDEFGNKIRGATIQLLQNNSQVATTTTNSDGYYSFERTYTVLGNYTLKTTYAGDNSHNNSASDNKSLTVNKATTNLSILDSSSYSYGTSIKIAVSSNYGSFTPESVEITFNGVTETVTSKDSNGNFVYTLPNVKGGNYTVYAKYNGNNFYSSSNNNKSIYFKVPITDVILSKSGNNLIVQAFNGNSGVIVPIEKMIVGGAVSSEFNFSDMYTDGNGTATIPLNFPSGTYTVYVICYDNSSGTHKQSNNLTFTV